MKKYLLDTNICIAHNNFDLLIGCTAVTNQMVMVTDNIKDFKNIRDIEIENWIKH